MVATLLEIQVAASQCLQLRAFLKILLILIKVVILTRATTIASVFNVVALRTIIIIMQRTTNVYRILS